MTARARTSDPYTSHAAAATVDLSRAQQVVYAMFHAFGDMPDATLEKRTHLTISPSGTRTARKALQREGLVEEKGDVVLPSGRRALVWGLVVDDGQLTMEGV